MSVKWNGYEVKNVDPKPLLEKILVTYHMYYDREISHHDLIREIDKIWTFLAEEEYKQNPPPKEYPKSQKKIPS